MRGSSIYELPAVRKYLAIVEQNLMSHSADDRREIIGEVKRHIAESLSDSPTDEEVAAVLTQLGAPNDIDGDGEGESVTGHPKLVSYVALLVILVVSLILLVTAPVVALLFGAMELFVGWKLSKDSRKTVWFGRTILCIGLVTAVAAIVVLVFLMAASMELSLPS